MAIGTIGKTFHTSRGRSGRPPRQALPPSLRKLGKLPRFRREASHLCRSNPHPRSRQCSVLLCGCRQRQHPRQVRMDRRQRQHPRQVRLGRQRQKRGRRLDRASCLRVFDRSCRLGRAFCGRGSRRRRRRHRRQCRGRLGRAFCGRGSRRRRRRRRCPVTLGTVCTRAGNTDVLSHPVVMTLSRASGPASHIYVAACANKVYIYI